MFDDMEGWQGCWPFGLTLIGELNEITFDCINNIYNIGNTDHIWTKPFEWLELW